MFRSKGTASQLVNNSKKITTAVEDDIELNNSKRNSNVNLAFEDRLLEDVEDAVAKRDKKRWPQLKTLETIIALGISIPEKLGSY
jgi:hypothetical protein